MELWSWRLVSFTPSHRLAYIKTRWLKWWRIIWSRFISTLTGAAYIKHLKAKIHPERRCSFQSQNMESVCLENINALFLAAQTSAEGGLFIELQSIFAFTSCCRNSSKTGSLNWNKMLHYWIYTTCWNSNIDATTYQQHQAASSDK